MLDANKAKLTKTGTMTITEDGILISGFEGEGTTCRDVTALAAVWAIGILQRELMPTLEAPGDGKIWIED